MSDTEDNLDIKGTFRIHPGGDKIATVEGGGVLITMVVSKDADPDDIEQVVYRFPDMVTDLVGEYDRKKGIEDGDG